MLRTEVNSYEGAKGISDVFEAAGRVCDVLIEIDGGLNRGGVQLAQPTLDFANQIRELKGLHIMGLMYYGGVIYHVGGMDKIRSIRKKNTTISSTPPIFAPGGAFNHREMSATEIELFLGKHPDLLEKGSAGNPAAGDYIFNKDGSALGAESSLATPERCALRVIATVARQPDDHTAILDVGCENADHRPLRTIVKTTATVREHPELEMYSLNEEHGFVRSKED